MSTTHIVYLDKYYEVLITEGSAKFDLDIDSVMGPMDQGPQGMEADKTIEIAVGILYAVWCSYPDQVNEAIRKMSNDKIPEVWNQIVATRRGA